MWDSFLWHDRAVFHFLMEEDERRSYADVLRGITPGGYVVVVATFDSHGPTHYSGLLAVRYGAAEPAEVPTAGREPWRR